VPVCGELSLVLLDQGQGRSGKLLLLLDQSLLDSVPFFQQLELFLLLLQLLDQVLAVEEHSIELPLHGSQVSLLD